MHHHIFLLLLNDALHLAPIGPRPHKILDVGTGTGIWAIDMAEYAARKTYQLFHVANRRSQYPSAEVTGIDLSPVQPKWYSSRPKRLASKTDN